MENKIMDNKRIIVSLLLVFLVALSVSAVSAEDAAADAIAVDEAVDEIAIDDSADIVAANTRQPENNTAEAISSVITAAEEGDTIDLSKFDTYDVLNNTIEVGVKGITIKGNGNTIIQGWGGPGNGIFHVSASGVTFQGIKFIDTNPNSVLTYYDDSTKNANEVKGWGIHFQKAQDGVVDNCSFINFNHGVRIQQQANGVTVKNSYFEGVTNYLRNDPTVNVEKGTKAVGVMGSQNPTIINNIFNGSMLDAISLASGCGGAVVSGNTFIGNSYSIYFGGASTAGTAINNNTFINCGAFSGVDSNGTAVVWDTLPVISIQKSAAGLQIVNNDFEAINNNVLIAAEAGNAAHGYPSEIGNIDVTGNTVTKFSDDVITQSVTLLHILSRGGDLNPTGPIDVSGNIFTGAVRAVTYWNTEWGSETGNVSDIVIPKGSLAPTTIAVSSIAENTIAGVLKDINGNVLAGETISYTAGDVNGTVETESDGSFSIVANSGDLVEILFAGTSKLAESSINVTVPAAAEQIATIVESESVITRYANDYSAGERGILASGTLKDADGNPLANKTCYVAVNGIIYDNNTDNRTITDENGVFGVPVNLAAANTYTYALVFLGDDGYKASLNCTKVILEKKPVTLTAASKSFKASAKTKKITVTMKTIKNAYDGKTYLSAGKKITLKLNGVTYTAKTNAKGVATFNVKITKKGKYTAKISFAGDKTYDSSSKSITVTIK
jgi:parallel beta-helix repeat protein